MTRQNKIKIVSPILLLLLAACAPTGGTTDPVKVGAWGGITYKVGQNDNLESQLQQMEQKQISLNQDLDKAKSNLDESVSILEQYRKKLQKTRFKTQKSADAAKKVSNELELKRMDLIEKKHELDDMEEQIQALKVQKKSSAEKLIRLEYAEEELKQAKEEIALLNDVLENDLFIEAENALKYE